MHVQIYGAKTLDDVRALVDVGVDHVGLGLQRGEEAAVAERIAAIRGRVTVVLLPLVDDADEMVAAVERLRPDVVHISNDVEKLGVDEINAFCTAVAPTKVMKAIPVAPPAYSDTIDSVGLARAFDPYVDYLLLDTKLNEDEPMPGWIGVTGKTHDWAVSRAIVEACETPVILAGGLTPDNVADAIRVVRPWGVDANTGLNVREGKKDLPKCRAFVENARRAAQQIAEG